MGPIRFPGEENFICVFKIDEFGLFGVTLLNLNDGRGTLSELADSGGKEGEFFALRGLSYRSPLDRYRYLDVYLRCKPRDLRNDNWAVFTICLYPIGWRWSAARRFLAFL